MSRAQVSSFPFVPKDPVSPMSDPLILISHTLCPYVQRVAITLAEKGLVHERRDIDLANKPAWFLEISPMGKTPVLLVGDDVIFESSVICEYLDDIAQPTLHPTDALRRARHRAWMEFGSGMLNLMGALYSAADEATLQARARDIHRRMAQLEATLTDGPYFDGAFSLVDAVFAPVFRYFEVLDDIDDFHVWDGLPKVQRWRAALAARESVKNAVSPSYRQLLSVFLGARNSALARRLHTAGSLIPSAGSTCP